MQEKTELEKAEYRDIARDTHFQHCKEGSYCSNVLAHTPYETKGEAYVLLGNAKIFNNKHVKNFDAGSLEYGRDD